MSIFDLLTWAGFALGLLLGGQFAFQFGTLPGIFGGLIGGLAGFVLGRIPLMLALCVAQKSLQSQTVEELRAMLRDPSCLAPNLALLELSSRGEDVQPELPIVLDMLVDASIDRRSRGWHALESVFPELAEQIADYRINDEEEDCKRKVQRLRDGRD